ncbi:uncharacterized protein LOC114189149 [Vigna unguiculata]|uniref:uncharacterized protein LOC114189149 n=1 Tax=Vigna unguiculata TaxID=3917 RepID=UPI001015ED4C|nr:uncharacterized protein LOC114189149 [Vigna unguiculata]
MGVRTKELIFLRRKLEYSVTIQCNKETGLSVEFNGPYMYKGGYFYDALGLQRKREVLGKPPQELTEKVESEFEGKEYTLLKRDQTPSAKAKRAINKDAQTVAVVNTAAQATGLINNIGGQTQGYFNGAILNNVKFYGPL